MTPDYRHPPLTVPLGRSPEFVEASLRLCRCAMLGGGTLFAIVWIGGSIISPQQAGGDKSLGGGLLSLGIILFAIYVCWRFVRAKIRNYASSPDGVFEAALNDHSVVFRWRNGSETVVDYADIDGVAVMYASEYKDYDALALWLFDAYGSHYAIKNLHSDGEKVEALAEAIRAAVRAACGICPGDKEQDRSIRRIQRDTLPFGRMGKICIYLGPLVLLFVTIMVEREVWMENAVLSSGVAATGLTTAIHPDEADIFVEYEFRDATETRHAGKGRLRLNDAESLLLHGPIDVMYLPDSPDRNLPIEHIINPGLVIRIMVWIMTVLMLSGAALVFSGLEIAIIRGRIALLRRHELEEEWWERVGGVV